MNTASKSGANRGRGQSNYPHIAAGFAANIAPALQLCALIMQIFAACGWRQTLSVAVFEISWQVDNTNATLRS